MICRNSEHPLLQPYRKLIGLSPPTQEFTPVHLADLNLRRDDKGQNGQATASFSSYRLMVHESVSLQGALMATPAIDTETTAGSALRMTSADVERFHRDGFVIVRQLADPGLCEQMLHATLDGLGRCIEPIEYEADLSYPGAPGGREAAGGQTARRLQQAHARHEVFTRWVACPELIGRVRQLLQPSLVMTLAHHNSIMTKQPRYSSDTRWHQDIRYWSFARPELVSVWLALGEECEENGSLRLIPGSHRIDFARDRFDDLAFFRPDLPENRALIETEVAAELQAGDVLFFHCRTLHAAGRNRTDNPKFSVVFSYRAADNPPLPGTRSASLPELLFAPAE